MAPHSVMTETDNMSTTLTNSSSTSPLFPSHGSTQTSVTNSPLLEHHPPFQSQHHQQQEAQPNNNDGASGWPQIAKFIAETPPFESYSRFRELNVKNLLYYQVELSVLREDLTILENRDRDRRESDAGKFAKHADNLVLSAEICPRPKDKEQWKQVLKIRRLLKQYNAAVLQHVQMSALPDPDSSNVEELRKWIRRADLGNYCIGGAGSDAWGKLENPEKRRKSLMEQVVQLLRSIFWPQRASPSRPDLVSTLPHRNMDGLTRWIHKEWIPVYHAWQDPPPAANPDDPEKLDQSSEKNEKIECPVSIHIRIQLKYMNICSC